MLMIPRLSRRSQITAFILLGIVLVIGFSLVFFISSLSKSGTSDKNVNRITQANLEKGKINAVVDECLDRSAKKGLYLIASQGGFIFADQNYSTIDFGLPNITIDDERVAFLVYSQDPDLVSAPPSYPCYEPGKAASGLSGDACFKSYDHTDDMYPFGEVGEPRYNLRPGLCKSMNLTRSGLIDLKFACECQRCDLPEYSIQGQLEAYILNSTISCLNFSAFKDYEIRVIENSSLSTNITFSDEDVRVYLTLPIEMRSKNGLPLTEVMYFYDNVPVRIKSMYNLLFAKRSVQKYDGAISQDVKNVSFNIVDDMRKLISANYDDFSVKKEMIPGGDLITIEDTRQESMIGGKKFVFRFARQNRRPALDYIDYVNDPSKDYQIYVGAGDKLEISPLGYDPDEDQLVYHYDGWKTPQDTPEDPDCQGYDSNEWQESDEYLLADSSIGCLHPFYGRTQKRCASVMTTECDVGYHNLTISVIDPSGLEDYQKLRVLVNDKPTAKFTLENWYDDISGEICSVEDPFTLKVEISDKLSEQLGEEVEFRWDAKVGKNIVFKDNQFNTYSEKELPEDNAQDIASVKDELENMHISAGEQLAVMVEMRDSQMKELNKSVDSATDLVDIYQCLPHRSSAPSYPFNNLDPKINNTLIPGGRFAVEDISYQANHTCCVGESETDSYGTYASSSQTCFSLEDYGCKADFTDSSKPTYLGDYTSLSVIIDGDSTDVFKREIERRCGFSGKEFSDRGNVCAGDFTARSITKVQSCPEEGMDPKCSVCRYGHDSCFQMPSETVCDSTIHKEGQACYVLWCGSEGRCDYKKGVACPD